MCLYIINMQVMQDLSIMSLIMTFRRSFSWEFFDLLYLLSWPSGLLKRQCIDRELPYWRFRMNSNPAVAVAPFGKALYPHCQVFWRRLSAVGPVYRRVTPYARKRTHFTSRKRAGRNPGEVVSQSNIRKWVNDVDPSWFTLEGYNSV